MENLERRFAALEDPGFQSDKDSKTFTVENQQAKENEMAAGGLIHEARGGSHAPRDPGV